MSFLQRVQWDAAKGAHFDAGMRYLFIKPEALMGFVLELPAGIRPVAIDAMARSVAIHGGKSAQTYQAMGADEGEKLLAVIQGTAAELGWGIWRFERAEGALRLTVANSPFAAGYGPAEFPVCGPIRGMLTAVGAMVLGAPVTVAETACAAMGAPECRFDVEVAR